MALAGCGAHPGSVPAPLDPPDTASTMPAAAHVPVDVAAPASVGAPAAVPTAASVQAAPAVPAPAVTAIPSATAGGPTLRAVAPGTSALSVSLAPGRADVLALGTGDGPAGDLVVAAGGQTVASAYHLASVPTAPAGSEAALRAWDARFAGLRHKPGYHLAATTDVKVGDTASFWVYVQDAATPTDQQVQAHVAYVGEHCLMVVDDEEGASLDARATEMGQAFDQHIYPTDAGVFGAPVAGDRDPRVTILLSPAVDDHGQGSTLGYFTLRDLFSPTDAPGEPALQHSSQRLMLYVSSAIAAHGRAADYLGTLAHELQHLINATHKVSNGAPAPEETWLDEGLAMYAMQVNGFGLDSDAGVLFDHVQGYLAHPERYSLTAWDQDPNGSAYGAVYLFVTYLVDRYGVDVLKELVAARETGEANIDARLRTRNGSFDHVFTDWVAANVLDGQAASGAVPGYRSIDLHGTYAGRALSGVAVRSVDLPGSPSLSLLPRSASYLRLASAAGGTFQLGFQGGLAPRTGGWLLEP